MLAFLFLETPLDHDAARVRRRWVMPRAAPWKHSSYRRSSRGAGCRPMFTSFIFDAKTQGETGSSTLQKDLVIKCYKPERGG